MSSALFAPSLLLLLARTVRGRFVRMTRLLKSPKYVVGALASLAYFAFMLAGPIRGSRVWNYTKGSLDAAELAGIHVLVALGLALFLSLSWLFTRGRAALPLSESELHQLLAAPLERRHVMRYALLKAQPGILIGAFIAGILLRTGNAVDQLHRMLAVWLMLNLYMFHSTGLSLWKSTWVAQPLRKRWPRRFASLAGVLAFWTIVVTGLASVVTTFVGMPDMANTAAGAHDAFALKKAVLHALGASGTQGMLGIVLAPLRWATAPLFHAEGVIQLGLAWGIPILMLVALDQWVTRSPARFEEATLERAREVTRVRTLGFEYFSSRSRERMGGGTRRNVVFQLAPTGRPEVAVLWKSLMYLRRTPWTRLLLVRGAIIVGTAAVLTIFGAPDVWVVILTTSGTMLAGVASLLSGNMTRNDLRRGVLQLDILRTWPVSSTRLVAAEVLGAGLSAMVMTTLALSVAYGAALSLDLSRVAGTFDGQADRELAQAVANLGVSTWLAATSAFVSLLILSAGVTLLTSSLQNLGVALFPGWMNLSRGAQRGAGAVGPRILMSSVMLFTMILGLLPGALLVGLVLFAQNQAGVEFSWWEAPPLAALLVAPLFVEAVFIVRATAAAWDRIDPTMELLGEAGAEA